MEDVWVRRFDQSTQDYYYINAKNKTVTQETPNSASIWEEHLDNKTQKVFYWNPITKDSKWKLSIQKEPKQASPRAKRRPKEKEKERLRREFEAINVPSDTESKYIVVTDKNPSQNVPISSPESKEEGEGDWIKVWDENSKRTFWFNQKTKQSTWTDPSKPSIERETEEELSSVWKKVFDEESKRMFFYNTLTGESQWEKPLLKVEKLEREAGKTEGSGNGEWEELNDPVTNRVYFYNRKKGLSQWERPPELGKGSQKEEAKNIWEEIRDPESGRIFFHNRVTGLSQWHYPYEDEILQLHSDSQTPQIGFTPASTQTQNKEEAHQTQTTDFYLPPSFSEQSVPKPMQAPPVQITKSNTTPSHAPVMIHATTQQGPVLPPSSPVSYQPSSRVGRPIEPLDQPRTPIHYPEEPKAAVDPQGLESRFLIAGYLKKRARYGMRTFLPRFWILEERSDGSLVLKYYTDEESSVVSPEKPLGSIDLIHNVGNIEEVTEVDGEYDPEFKNLDFKLLIHTNVYTYVLTLRAYSEEDAFQWLRILRKYKSSHSEAPPFVPSHTQPSPSASSPRLNLSLHAKEKEREIDEEAVRRDEDKEDEKRREFLQKEKDRGVKVVTAKLDLSQSDDENEEEAEESEEEERWKERLFLFGSGQRNRRDNPFLPPSSSSESDEYSYYSHSETDEESQDLNPLLSSAFQ